MFLKKESRAFFLIVDVTCAGWDSFKYFLMAHFHQQYMLDPPLYICLSTHCLFIHLLLYS